MNQSLNIVILGGGFGTRIANSTNGIPKGLIATQETTLLGRVISDLQSLNQLGQVTLVTNEQYFDQYSQYFQQNHPHFKITIINDGATNNDNRLGALGDLAFALDKTGGWTTDTLVIPTDTYYSFSLSELIDFYSTHPNFITVVREMDKSEIKDRLGCAILKDTQIIDFIEKPADPPSPYAAIPFYLYPAHILALLKQYQKEGNSMDAPGSVIPWLIKNDGPIYAMIVNSPTIDVGTPPDIKTLNQVTSNQAN